MARKWAGVLAIEGQQTGDGRIIAEGAITWVDPPLPLKVQHDGDGPDVLIGTIDTIERVGTEIRATGTIDDQTEAGADVVRRLTDGTAALGHRWGLSIEPDDFAMELVDNNPSGQESDVVEPVQASGLFPLLLNRGGYVSASGVNTIRHSARPRRYTITSTGGLPLIVAAAGEPDPVDAPVVIQDSADSMVQRFTKMRIRAVALAVTEAIVGAYLELADDGEPTEQESDAVAASARLALIASGADLISFHPALFSQPEPEVQQAFRIDKVQQADGAFVWVFSGHVHPWGACHVGSPDRCISAPPSPSDYALFNSTGGEVLVKDAQGEARLAVAPFVWDCNHADLSTPTDEVLDHYAHTAAVFGFGRVVQGTLGPWACGVLRPDLTAEQLTALSAIGQLSGDWRPVNGRLDLYAVQAVGRPGFPIERPLAASACSCDGGAITSGAGALTEDVLVRAFRTAMRAERDAEREDARRWARARQVLS